MKLIKHETHEMTAEQFWTPIGVMLPEGVEFSIVESGGQSERSDLVVLGYYPRLLKDGDWIVRGPGKRVKVYAEAEFATVLSDGWEPEPAAEAEP